MYSFFVKWSWKLPWFRITSKKEKSPPLANIVFIIAESLSNKLQLPNLACRNREGFTINHHIQRLQGRGEGGAGTGGSELMRHMALSYGLKQKLNHTTTDITPDMVLVFSFYRHIQLERKYLYLGIFFFYQTLAKDYNYLLRSRVVVFTIRHLRMLPAANARTNFYRHKTITLQGMFSYNSSWKIWPLVLLIPHRLPYKIDLSGCQFDQLEILWLNTNPVSFQNYA